MQVIPASSTAPSVPPSEPDLEGEIHYALRAESLTWHTGISKPLSLCQPIYSALCAIAIPGGFMACFVLANVVPGPELARFGVVALLIATAIFLVRRRSRRDKLASERLAHTFPAMSNQRYRLRVAGPGVQLDRLRSLIGDEVDEFEPRVFRVGRAKRRGARDSLIFGAIFLVILAGVVLPARNHLRVPMMAMVIIYAATTLSVLAWAFLWPAYLRFVPGRLDILRYGVLGRGKPRVRSIDLTTARVLVNVPGSAILFFPEDPRVALLDVGPLPGGEPLAFERAILAAARSRIPSPPLPDDELIG